MIFKTIIPLDLANDYLAGAVLLGAAPCTAMVFVWSSLTRGNPAYTLVQVATNDLIILLLFVLLSCGEANRDTKLKNEMEGQGWTCTDTSCTILYAIYNYEYTFSTMTLTSSWTNETDGDTSGTISLNLATGDLSENLAVSVSEVFGETLTYDYTGNIYTEEYTCASNEFENVCMSEVIPETYLDLVYQYITGIVEVAGLTLDDFHTSTNNIKE